MRLIRNQTLDGSCKYALLRLDKMRLDGVALATLLDRLGELSKYVEVAGLNSPEEAFVIKLKDQNSPAALGAYAAEAYNNGDRQLSNEVLGLLSRAGKYSPDCKAPD